ncbi:hypothetical protein [Geobacter sp. AOG2]|uniref:hypothetical protein n=1 Tax=Geobacter sp. AOG2 TaxID=1566347 RepID=UPI001CC36E65|nr:hypothetical protein [Geobacter sp. AOG2]GFE61414.1 hypothetical protein AOG2_20010 [Geobacter sp. AOG2]
MNLRIPFRQILPMGVLVVLSGLTGCATVDQKIALNHAPAEHPLGKHNGEIVASRLDVPASDTKNSRGEWTNDALLPELKRAGYTATSAPSISYGIFRGILITDTRVYLDVNKSLASDQSKHELKFNVDMVLNGTKAKTFTVVSRDNSTLLTAAKEIKEKIMFNYLQDVMQQIVPDIIALIEK